ncbi:3-hydroxyacyl-[acyl-carrier-protein] dehydratase FabZ [bioreactor metagenome]|uniref:3-hydroxyacyl-[acyl-carrier-protein] dehydratase FabZ n=1 Tax=bioreactor metagenome TaxID=1076179 RepID=A0A644WRB6_9ZZZZ
MNKEEIQHILPHRDDMLLIEEAFLKEDIACARYHFRGDEWFFHGHFPGFPVVPGVILCEILAQSAAVLMSGTLAEDMIPYFTGLDKVRFKNPVHPGDTIETECSITKAKPPFYFAEGRGIVAGKVCVRAEFSFALIKR